LPLNHFGKTDFFAIHFCFVDFVSQHNVKVWSVIRKQY
jgi:hypothetical protein